MKPPNTGYTPLNIAITVFFYAGIIGNGIGYLNTNKPIYATMSLLSAVLLMLFRHYFVNGNINKK